MTEARYRLATAPINITIPQGETYYQRWEFGFDDPVAPFPFFAEDGVTLLWKGRSMIKAAVGDAVPLISLTTEDGGVVIDTVTDDDGVVHTYYALYLTATQTASLPAGKCVYDIEFERISDGWVIRPQGGKVTVPAEVTT